MKKKTVWVSHAMIACLIILGIEMLSAGSVTAGAAFPGRHPLPFLCNVLLVWITLQPAVLFRKRNTWRISVSIFWLLLGGVNASLLRKRVTPFNYTDSKLLKELLSMQSNGYYNKKEEAMILAFLVLLVLFIGGYWWKEKPYQGKIRRGKELLILGISALAIYAVLRLGIAFGFLASYYGNLAQGYKDYGFVYSFVISAAGSGMQKPKGYTKEAIDRIQKEKEPLSSSFDPKDLPNIVFLQLESFMDPDQIQKLHYSEDPIPFFHQLMEENPTGYLKVPMIGAGTCNTEMEVLTGMGVRFFGLGEIPYKTTLKDIPCESSAHVLGKIGYHTTAMHNFSGNFYSRADVFANLGFDCFDCREMMDIVHYNTRHTWPADDILVDETRKILDASEGTPDYIYGITVQSHGEYPDHRVSQEIPIRVFGEEDRQRLYRFEYYINEIHKVDQVLQDYISMLEQREEKTIVVMFGDHLPTLGLTEEELKNGDLFATPYVIWSNYDIPENQEMEKYGENLPDYELMACILDSLGIREGTMFRFWQMQRRKAEEDPDLLKKWELLQYDILFGKKYAYGDSGKDNEEYGPSQMEFGCEDVVIDEVQTGMSGLMLYINGRNFTRWSKVYVNDEPVKREYVSGICLRISGKDVRPGDIITVKQVGSENRVFRTSNSYHY